MIDKKERANRIWILGILGILGIMKLKIKRGIVEG